MAGTQYGEPKFPIRMNYVTSENQRKRLDDLAKSDEFESLGEVQRVLIEEALDMRDEAAKAQVEYEQTEEGGEVCEVVETGQGAAVVRGPRSLGGVPVGLARVGDNLAKAAGGVPVSSSTTATPLTRAQLMAQERGEG